MPIAYSRTAGSKSPRNALLITDYVTLLDAGCLSPSEINYGFKAYIPEALLHLGPGQYLRLFRKSFAAGLGQPSCKHPNPVATDLHSRLKALFDQPIFLHSSEVPRMSKPNLKLNVDDIAQDEGVLSGGGLTSSNSANSAASATRKSLHQNIIGKLRPLPFQYHWTVWYDKHTDSRDYDNRLYILHEDVADIATFYRVYNNYPWDKVRFRDTVHIFRKGVKPVWEDPENLNGGSWTFRVPKSKSQAFFHEIAILCMANELQAAVESEHDHVLGVSTSVRFNTHLISVWHKSGSNGDAIKALEATIIGRLSPELRPTGNSFFYKRHDEHEGFQQAIEHAAKSGDAPAPPGAQVELKETESTTEA